MCELCAATWLFARGGGIAVESGQDDSRKFDVFNLEIVKAHQYYLSRRLVLFHNDAGLVGGLEHASRIGAAAEGAGRSRDVAKGIAHPKSHWMDESVPLSPLGEAFLGYA